MKPLKTRTEIIESFKKILKTIEEECNRLAEEQEPKFERVEEKEIYFFIRFDGNDGIVVVDDEEQDDPLDEAAYDNNNYFKTEQRAQEVADKFKFLLKLERLHDTFCPDYVPNWSEQDETRFAIYFDVPNKRYSSCYSLYVQEICGVYFPSKEIAQKVCDILNAELEESYEN